MTTQPDTLKNAVDALGLEYKAEFIPFSKSRNAKKAVKPGDYSLNWRVTVGKGRNSLTTDYMQGIAHIPGYKETWSGRLSVDEFDRIKQACENGTMIGRSRFITNTKITMPKLHDVMYALAMDASAIDHASFEEWANEYGYSPDSREAEKIYKQCLDIALKLRAMIGDEGLNTLREASQDY